MIVHLLCLVSKRPSLHTVGSSTAAGSPQPLADVVESGQRQHHCQQEMPGVPAAPPPSGRDSCSSHLR